MINSESLVSIINFLGNPGGGKSTLCNSVIGKVVFESGVSVGKGLTTKTQSYKLENRLIVDSPGLSDPVMRERAAS
ncbi:hypothetical protein PPL_01232 [Heterostelium album PN500]|uniref:EngC GTPase domain-containing protein n=1 Tax=Heterostelium pallidum (strain ATCC 26659 / Pp 5 / PN500) TaxID=670386 RepID=D3AYH2_HETP5|nr:hypothetical protein PPL_01232 [Heterostelium album PN500]EFA85999.1 hypothetical protein PPL_01232 [Heterostelium album PN500]|eukprot:XP_020438105.1 hypothetical protein PPL_01232 [Heterostelium album PN500]